VSKTVLVVSSDLNFRNIVRKVLKKHAFVVSESDSLKMSISKISSAEFNFILVFEETHGDASIDVVKHAELHTESMILLMLMNWKSDLALFMGHTNKVLIAPFTEKRILNAIAD